jgi:hypothetical protein
MKTQLPTFLVIVALILGVTIIALALIRTARAQTPEQWWQLVMMIDQQRDRLDNDERKFIRNVTNRLAVSKDATPTPEHRRWLLSIKQRLEKTK